MHVHGVISPTDSGRRGAVVRFRTSEEEALGCLVGNGGRGQRMGSYFRAVEEAWTKNRGAEQSLGRCGCGRFGHNVAAALRSCGIGLPGFPEARSTPRVVGGERPTQAAHGAQQAVRRP